jgi:hypothetical protein
LHYRAIPTKPQTPRGDCDAPVVLSLERATTAREEERSFDMIPRHVLMLSTAVALTTMAAGTASSQTSNLVLQPRVPRIKFLTPLPAPTVVNLTATTFCQQLQGLRCPPVLTNGGGAGNALPTIEPVFKANLPNVRVSFVLEEIENEIVAGGGVSGDPYAFVEWLTTSSAASIETGGPYGYPLPPPGVTWDDLYHAVIYDAIVFNACESFSAFPVDHDASIEGNGVEIGAFHGVDASTLNHTGYYNFSYKAHATSAGGAVSDFRFSGKVNVVCTALNSLP